MRPSLIVRNSAIYLKADAALRNGTTNDEYVWCLLAAVLAHEGAHKGPMTEREALIAEAEQLRRCLFAGHLHTGSGWSAGAYLLKVEAESCVSRGSIIDEGSSRGFFTSVLDDGS